MIKKVLEKRDKQRLLPKLKELLAGYGVIDERYFDLIVDKTWEKEDEVLSRSLEFLEKLKENRIEQSGLEERIKDLLHTPDEKPKKKIINSLISKLDSQEERLRQDSILALKKLIELSFSEEKEEDFVYIRERLKEELHICALSILQKVGDESSLQAIKEFLRKRRKGILGRLSRDEVTEKALKILSLRDKEISLTRF